MTMEKIRPISRRKKMLYTVDLKTSNVTEGTHERDSLLGNNYPD